MRRALLMLPLAALVLAPTAAAHVTVQPDHLRRGTTETITFTVPNEREAGAIIAFDVQLPAGVSTVGRPATWKRIAVAPGARRQFRLTLRFPDRTGDVQLVANERFADGTADTFYPVVTLTGTSLGTDVKVALIAGAALLAVALAAFFVGLTRWLRS